MSENLRGLFFLTHTVESPNRIGLVPLQLRSDETPHRTAPAPDPKILGDGIDQTPQRTGDPNTLSQRGYGRLFSIHTWVISCFIIIVLVRRLSTACRTFWRHSVLYLLNIIIFFYFLLVYYHYNCACIVFYTEQLTLLL